MSLFGLAVWIYTCCLRLFLLRVLFFPPRIFRACPVLVQWAGFQMKVFPDRGGQLPEGQSPGPYSGPPHFRNTPSVLAEVFSVPRIGQDARIAFVGFFFFFLSRQKICERQFSQLLRIWERPAVVSVYNFVLREPPSRGHGRLQLRPPHPGAPHFKGGRVVCGLVAAHFSAE